MIRLTKRIPKKQRGVALVTTLICVMLISVAAVAFIDRSTQSIRDANHHEKDVQTTQLCEAGLQAILRDLWRPFKQQQKFTWLRDETEGATLDEPKHVIMGELDQIGRYAAAVISSFEDPIDPNTQTIVIRAVGWIDYDGDGEFDDDEPSRVVDVSSQFQLRRSPIFDYAYFVNNYGWFENFSPSTLIINGDIRANGNLDFINGSPTVNGSVGAANNDKLFDKNAGRINLPPVKWTDSKYKTEQAKSGNERWRQPFNSATHGAIGSNDFQKWRDLVFFSGAGIDKNRPYGTVMLDAAGTTGWQRTSTSTTPTYNVLDGNPSQEIIMPDLQDIDYYRTLSTTYDGKPYYNDGTPNPYAVPSSDPGGTPRAYVEVWDPDTSQYVEVTVNGLGGSAVLVGDSTHPIRINGPVTFDKDVAIKGYLAGQGTIYTGRNIHIVGSLRYKSPPNFKGSDMQAVDNSNMKKDMLGLAARASIFMGDTTDLSSTAKQYMRPPFTHGRYDENGNEVPAFDIDRVGADGLLPYQTFELDDEIEDIAEGVNQIDAIMYTNFLGGGDVATSGSGFTINGSIISRDEAMVVWAGNSKMVYDNRIRERSVDNEPLIDLMLPRSPTMLRSTWQDRGFEMH